MGSETQSQDPPVAMEAEAVIRLGQGYTKKTPFVLIHEAFASNANRNGSLVAIEHESHQITYGELDAASTRLSQRLSSLGLRPRNRVVLLVQRSIPMIVAVLAVLKSGCQYVPLDGGVVSDGALAHVLDETESPFVLCLPRYEKRARQFATSRTNVVALGDFIDSTHGDIESGEALQVHPDDGAYVIYTSGSTGKPKGVDVTHRNVTNLLSMAPGNLSVQPGRRVAQLLSVSFDMAAWEILGTLMNGGTLCLRSSDWDATLCKVDTIIATPTILGTLNEEKFPNITTVALAGEPCPLKLADQWAKGRHFFNCCGPTEVTIVNTMHKHELGQELSIGRPIPNTSVYILDGNEELVPFGVSGTMWVGGTCVSRGYVELPDQTKTRYKRDKFKDDGSVMFNTGDLCRWREDGTLEPMGRMDDQVKIKGFRVELDGVSAVLESHPTVSKACAVFIDGTLCAYFVTSEAVSDHEMHATCVASLPYYAIPTIWRQIPAMPLTANGKINKAMLKTWLASQLASIKLSTLSEERLKTEELAASKALAQPSTIRLPLNKKECTIETRSLADTNSLEEILILPPERGRSTHMRLRYHVFTMYRRLFTFVFIGNVAIILTLFAYRRTLRHLQLSDLATATAANITVALLMRQEYVINFLFTVACSISTWMPLFIRRNCAKVFHIGGIHSSAGVAAVFWFIIFTVAATIGAVAPKKTSFGASNPGIVLVAYITLLLFVSIIITAHPSFRAKRHNIFEKTHRFSGWTILILFWILTILSADASHRTLSQALIREPTLYLLIVSTICVILPWIRLRKVLVRPEVLSPHAIRLHFSYTNTYPGTAVRISERPLMEWHAFATVAKPGVDGFSLVVSNAGDWTKRQIGRVPERLWVRGIPACGVLRIAPLFKRIVLVATGSGIGPCLPVLLARKVPMRVFWSTPNPEDTFGEEIMASVRGADSKAVVWNTRRQGKPDMIKEVWKLVAESGKTEGKYNVEAVCVIANKKVTEMIVRGMETRGMAAYGAIFDS